MTVFFHGNFGLSRSRMARLADLASKDPTRSDSDLAKAFDYGAPFASTYRSWLHKAGIAKLGRPFQLTPHGKIALQFDPGFQKLETMWFMHHELTADQERAEAWFFFMCEFRVNNKTFTKRTLQMALMDKLRSHSETHFGPRSKMNPIIVRKLIECYEAEDGLGPLQLLKRIGPDTFEFGVVPELGPWLDAAEFEQALS